MRNFMLIVLVAFLCPVLVFAVRGDEPPVKRPAPQEKKDTGKKDADQKNRDQNSRDHFEEFDPGKVDDAPPSELDVDPTLEPPVARRAQDGDNNDDMNVEGPAPAQKVPLLPGLKDSGPLGPGIQPSSPGGDGFGGLKSGGTGSGFDSRGKTAHDRLLASGGGDKQSERAVTAALIWLANHQMSDGSWSLENYTQRCLDKSCTGQGDVSADAGATAMGLLPFLAAGQTHKSKGPYKDHIGRAVAWLLRNQQPDGNLAKGAHQMMYSHGLATIALCECYGLSGDKRVGIAAQKAVDFIVAAQNRGDGGWRYNPGDAGDTSVTGWELMALKSAHMAGLRVGGSTFSGISKWLDAAAVHEGAEYCYQPGVGQSDAMTAVGLLCRQYLGAKRENPMLKGGTEFLMKNLPDETSKNVYYWYYATQVMHNMNDKDWNLWNRKMRDLLVKTQCRNDNCAKGSWDPANDAWGRHGGRVMQTALSCLTLEIYYRYLPLYKAEAADAGNAAKTKPAE